MRGRVLTSIALCGAFACANAAADEIDYARVMNSIARDIAALKADYPQLAQFDAAGVDAGEPKISYAFHTHAPPRSGGWTSGVPNPDSDGVWFYIDFHDPDSTAQIHTQPVIGAQCLGVKRVSFLILEGDATRSIVGAIQKILQAHGAGRCGRPHRSNGVRERIS